MKPTFPPMFIAISKITGRAIECNKSPVRHTTLALKSAVRNAIWLEDHQALYESLKTLGLSGMFEPMNVPMQAIRALYWGSMPPAHADKEYAPSLCQIHKQWEQNLATNHKGLTPWDEMSSIQFYKITPQGFIPCDHQGN